MQARRRPGRRRSSGRTSCRSGFIAATSSRSCCDADPPLLELAALDQGVGLVVPRGPAAATTAPTRRVTSRLRGGEHVTHLRLGLSRRPAAISGCSASIPDTAPGLTAAACQPEGRPAHRADRAVRSAPGRTSGSPGRELRRVSQAAATTCPRRFVRVPSSSTVGIVDVAADGEHLVAAQPGQRPVGRPVQHRVQRAEVVRVRPGRRRCRRQRGRQPRLARASVVASTSLLGDARARPGRSAAAPRAAARGPAAGPARRCRSSAVASPADAAVARRLRWDRRTRPAGPRPGR